MSRREVAKALLGLLYLAFVVYAFVLTAQAAQADDWGRAIFFLILLLTMIRRAPKGPTAA